jgi:rare lipoprotein A
MTFRRPISMLVAAPVLGALALPTGGLAAGGGATATAPVARASTQSGTSLWARRGMLVHRTQVFRGFVPPRSAGRTVMIQGHPRRGGWQSVATARTGRHGGFRAAWTPRHLGRYTFRAVVVGTAGAARTGAPQVRVTVFLPATATYYGPGFYGKRTACGVRLTRRTLGVAHRWLPCGTRVVFLLHGRTVTVPVIDRGPFGPQASWDLTSATATKLGMTGTSRLGAVSLRGTR